MYIEPFFNWLVLYLDPTQDGLFAISADFRKSPERDIQSLFFEFRHTNYRCFYTGLSYRWTELGNQTGPRKYIILGKDVTSYQINFNSCFFLINMSPTFGILSRKITQLILFYKRRHVILINKLFFFIEVNK